MRTLEVNAGGGVVQRHFLLAGETYTIGRKECRILLPNGDPSISRHHADITVQQQLQYNNHSNNNGYNGDNNNDDNDICAVVDFVLRDCSKHGTFVNRERLVRDTVRFVYADDMIKFGKRISARVCDTGMLLILAESPFLNDTDRQLLRDLAQRLGASIVRGPVPAPATLRGQGQDVMALLYITHDMYELTPAVLLAMAQQYHVTTVSYLQSLVLLLQENSALTPAEFPTPTVPQPANVHFNREEYTPPPTTFYDVGEFLSRNSTGKTWTSLLRPYTFLLLDAGMKEKYEALLQICGASVVLISPDNASKFHTYIQDMNTIALTSDEMFDSLEAALAMGKEPSMENNSPPRNNHHNNNNSSKKKEKQRGAVQDNEIVESAYLALYKAGICVIPELNVQRAIFTCNAAEINAKPTARSLIRKEDTTSNVVTTEKDDNDNTNTVQTTEKDKNVDNIRKKETNGSKPLREIETNAECQAMHNNNTNNTAPLLEKEKYNKVKDTKYEKYVDPHRENETNGTLGNELKEKEQQRPFLGSSVQPSVRHTGNTKRKSAEPINELSPKGKEKEKETTTVMNKQPSLEKRPVVVHAPSQVSARGTTITTTSTTQSSPTRRRVVAHKISMHTAQSSHSPRVSISRENEQTQQIEYETPPSSLLITSATSSRTASRLPSAEPVVPTHSEIMQRQQKRRQQRKTFESGNTTTNTTNTTVRQSSSVSRLALRRGSTASMHGGDSTGHSGRSNSAQKPRSASVVESRPTHNRKSSIANSYAQQTLSTPRRTPQPQPQSQQQQQRQPTSAVRTSSTTYRRNSTGRSMSPLVHYNRMSSKPILNEGELITTTALSHKQGPFPATSHMERSHSARQTDGMVNDNPDSAEVQEYIQRDKQLGRQAADFLCKFLDTFATDTEKSCRLLLKQGYLDAMSKKFLENGMQRVQEFLTAMQRALLDIVPMYSTESTRQRVHEVRKKSLTTLDRIKYTYEIVKAELPPFLIQQQQQYQQVRNGATSPMQPSLRRMSSSNNNWKSSFLHNH